MCIRDRGINFAATGDGPSVDSEVLDDYEKGTFTPTLFKGTGTTEVTYDWRYGKYVRVGDLVHVTLSMGISDTDTYSQAFIGGLPFSYNLQTGHFYYVQLFGYSWQSGYSDSGQDTKLFMEVNAGQNNTKAEIRTGAGKGTCPGTHIGASQRFTAQFSYPAV